MGTNPYIARTLEDFRSSFQWLATYPEVKTLEENEEFARQLERLVERHKDDIPRMARGWVFLFLLTPFKNELSCSSIPAVSRNVRDT